MRALAFAKRNFTEIIREPINLFFGIGFPSVLILLLFAIQANIPVSLFEIDSLAPAMPVFDLSFMTLFSATIIAKDKESAFLARLYATPMRAIDFILGYTLPMLPIALIQGLVCFIIGACLGMTLTVNLLISWLLVLPISVIFISLGLLCGSVLDVRAVGGLCGALLTNLTAWLSGIWFDLKLVGGAFKAAAELLPFMHATELERAVSMGDFSAFLTHFAWIIGYGVAITALSVWIFLRQMRK